MQPTFRAWLLLLCAAAAGAEIPMDHAAPVRFGAAFVETPAGTVARFNGDRGVSVPVQVTAAGETEVVARVVAPKGRRFRLQCRGHGLALEAESVGTGAPQEVALGKGRVAGGVGRLEVNSPRSRNIQLLGLRLAGVEATAPPDWSLATAYVDLGKGGHLGWRGLALKDGGTARIPVAVAVSVRAHLHLAYAVTSPARLTVGDRTYDVSPSAKTLRAEITLEPGTRLVALAASGGEIRIESIRLEGAKVSAAYPLPSGAAQSVHFGYPVPSGPDARWAYAEAIAEPGPEATYHCVLGFGEGYFGYQVRYQRGRPDDRWFIYSLWDNGYVRNHEKSETKEELRDKVVTLVAKGPDVAAYAFDHEGSGGHSHLDFRWEDRKPYAFLLGVEPDGTAAVFSAWVAGPGIDGWRFLASFRRPGTTARLDGLYSFVEDWTGHMGDQERACRYRNLWVADASGAWRRLTTANTSATAELGRKDYGHRVVADGVELRTGGYRHAEGRQGFSLPIPPAGEAPRIDFPKLPRGSK